MKRLLLIFTLLLFALGHASAQGITISGNVEDGFLKIGLPEAKVSLLREDSTVVADSLPLTKFFNGGNVPRYVIYSAEVPAVVQNYLLRVRLSGYDDAWRSVAVTDVKEREIEVPLISMRKMRTVDLKGATVKATRIKMYYRGDTIVYDATAFKLPDGSMLDDLIRQLPGTEIREGGEIYVNGRKVDELLLGSRSFMRGNKRVLMENLPYYTVKDLKVYERSSDESVALGHETGPKSYVMDVNLKKEYRTGYIGNAEAAAGTESRWLGRAFLLGFSDSWRHTLMANANNVSESRHIGERGQWTPSNMPQSRSTARSVASESHYSKKDGPLRNTLTASYDYITTSTDMRERRETFLSGMTPHSLTTSATRDKSHNLKLSNSFMYRKGFYLSFDTEYEHQHTNGNTQSAFRQWGDTLTAAMLTSARDRRSQWHAWGSFLTRVSVDKKKGRDVGLSAFYSHTEDNVDRASKYDVTQTASRSVTHNLDDTRRIDNQTNGNVFYSQPIFKDWSLYTNAGFTSRATNAHDYLYHPDTLTLSSQREALAAAPNSYDYRSYTYHETLQLSIYKYITRKLMPGIDIVSQLLNINLEVPFVQQKLDYRRGGGAVIDTTARRHRVYFSPSFEYHPRFGKGERQEVIASAGFKTADLDMVQTVGYRDDSQPLVVREGNANLKPRQTSYYSLQYILGKGPRNQSISLSSRLDYTHRDVAQSLRYDAATGVYTYRPKNVHGGYHLNCEAKYSRNLDEGRLWYVESKTGAALLHSVDYAMLSGQSESTLNKVNTSTLSENAYIQYNKGALNLRATGDVKWRRSTGRMRDFQSLSAVDYQYGFTARYTIPTLKTTLSADANMYSRRGYGSRSLNTDDFVVNAALSQSMLKGKLIASLEAYDIFHQISSTRYEVNAQGRTETWYRSLPHYLMAHLVYHFNINPRRK